MKTYRRERRRVGQRKQRILRRQQKARYQVREKPVISGGRPQQYEVAERVRGSAHGGIGAMHALVERLGLAKAIDSRLNLLQVHRPYFESDHVLNSAYNALCHGQRLDDIELRRSDDVFLDVIGAESLPDPTTAGDFCRRFSELDIRLLMEAFGENIKYAFVAKRHARRAIELNPLDGRAWLAYSELAFLDDAPAGYDRQCIDQSLRLLPNNASVLYAAGREARVDGDVERWIELWKKAFHRDVAVQQQIIRQMAEWTELPVEVIVKAFDPDVDAMDRAVEIFSQLGQEQNYRKALEVLAARLIERAQVPDNSDRATDWRKAAVAFHRLDNVEQVEACFKNAAEAAPTNFRVHFDYGSWLLTQGRPAAATEHLQWCQRMAPHDGQVQKALDALNRAIRRNDNIRQATATSQDLTGR